MRKRIDVDRLKKDFHTAAVARGIDPANGSTSYQAALVRAEQSTRRHQSTCTGWWKLDSAWGDIGVGYSDTEDEALRNVAADARPNRVKNIFQHPEPVVEVGSMEELLADALLAGMVAARSEYLGEMPLRERRAWERRNDTAAPRQRAKWAPIAGIPQRVPAAGAVM